MAFASCEKEFVPTLAHYSGTWTRTDFREIQYKLIIEEGEILHFYPYTLPDHELTVSFSAELTQDGWMAEIIRSYILDTVNVEIIRKFEGQLKDYSRMEVDPTSYEKIHDGVRIEYTTNIPSYLMKKE